MSYRNQQSDGTFAADDILANITEEEAKTTVKDSNDPFPGPGEYLMTVMEIVMDTFNKCFRLRCNIDSVLKGPAVSGRNCVITLWYNSDGAKAWTKQIVLQATTGQRFTKTEMRWIDVVKQLLKMQSAQFLVQRTFKEGRDKGRMFDNNEFFDANDLPDKFASTVDVDKLAALLTK